MNNTLILSNSHIRPRSNKEDLYKGEMRFPVNTDFFQTLYYHINFIPISNSPIFHQVTPLPLHVFSLQSIFFYLLHKPIPLSIIPFLSSLNYQFQPPLTLIFFSFFLSFLKKKKREENFFPCWNNVKQKKLQIPPCTTIVAGYKLFFKMVHKFNGNLNMNKETFS